MTVSPSVLYLPASGGPAQVTITATVTDATGVASVDYMLQSEKNFQYTIISGTMGGALTSGDGGLKLVSGTPQNGTWSDTFAFPGGPDGKWDVFVTPYDTVGNGTPASGQVELGGLTVVQCPCVPTAPAAPTATASDRSAILSWAPPSSDGGAAVTSYTVTAHPGGLTMSTDTLSATFPDLTPGTPYTFTVTATNAVGISASSPASEAVTPTGESNTPPPPSSSSPPPAAAPAAPAKPTVRTTKGHLVITWKVPASHGAPISRYLVTYNSTTKAVPGRSHSLTVKAKKGRYRVSVMAANVAGTSPASPVVTIKVK